MVELGGGFGLARETFAAFLVAEEMRREELQRHGPVEFRILGFVDDAHAAFTEFLGDFVVRDSGAEQD